MSTPFEIFWLHDTLRLHEVTVHENTSRVHYCEKCGALLYKRNEQQFEPASILNLTARVLKETTGLELTEARLELAKSISRRYRESIHGTK